MTNSLMCRVSTGQVQITGKSQGAKLSHCGINRLHVKIVTHNKQTLYRTLTPLDVTCYLILSAKY